MSEATTLPPEIEAKTRALDELRLAWESLLLAEVSGRVTDAHAHAWRALTDSSGRGSAAESPAAKLALKRLDELWSHLAGPSDMSLKGAIREHRVVALTEAFRRWHPLIPAEYRDRPDGRPTNDEVRQVRAAQIHGHDLRAVVGRPIEAAKTRLKVAIGKATRGGVVDDRPLADWARTAETSIGSVVRTALVDSTAYADQVAGTSLIHPDYIEGAA